jgi:hypothetical protein
MDKSVLTVETDYSKSDFKIDWKEIKTINTTTNFMMTLSNGRRVSGRIKSTEDGSLIILTNDGQSVEDELHEIVFMNSVSKGFWDQLSASISLGYSLTKAQNLKQFTLRSNLGYIAERWSADISYNGLNSTQDDIAPIQRKDGGLTFNFLLPKDWFIPVSLTFLSNTEQKIDLRLLGKLGIGNYIIHKNNAYWGISLGLNGNFEDFEGEESDRKTWEGFVGTELNLFDIGDFSILTKVVAYPSLTESGRIRADYVLDTKYDLPLDFYVQLGLTVNYDNKPVEGAPDTDYVFQTTFGWSW